MIVAEIGDWTLLLGRTHPAIVHLPVGILMLTVTFEILCYLKRFDNLRMVLPLLWKAGAFTAVIACVAGYLLSEEGGYEEDLVTIHQWTAISLAILAMCVAAMKTFIRISGFVNLVFVLAIMILLSVAGHFGGTLTHGEEFLNEPLGIISGEEEEAEIQVQRKQIANIDSAIVYSDLVHPLFEEKCGKCHNAKKLKGGLRTDEYQYLLKGGKSGAAILPNDPLGGELLKRINLPAGDKKRMPPKNKKQLTKEETELIRWWIQQGKGAERKTVGEVGKTPVMEKVLASLTRPEQVEVKEVELPEVSINEGSPSAIKILEATGAIVTRLSGETSYLSVNCVNAPMFGEKEVGLLLPLKDQIVWLKAGETRITDREMPRLHQLEHLTRLNLQGTLVTDAGIAGLEKLRYLQYLNLVGTKVSDESLNILAQAKKLKVVYLWHTPCTKEGVARLRKQRPDLEVNTGESE